MTTVSEVKKIWGDDPKSIYQVTDSMGARAKTWFNDGWTKLQVGDVMPATESREDRRDRTKTDLWLVKNQADGGFKGKGGGFQMGPKFSPDEMERAKMPSFCVSYAKDIVNVFIAQIKPNWEASGIIEFTDKIAHGLFDTMVSLRSRLPDVVPVKEAPVQPATSPGKAPSSPVVAPEVPKATPEPTQPPEPPKPKVKPAAKNTAPAPAPTPAPAPVSPPPAPVALKPNLPGSADKTKLPAVVAEALISAFAKLPKPLTQQQIEMLLGSPESPVTKAEWTAGDRVTALAIYAKIKTVDRDEYLKEFGVKVNGTVLVAI